jgi:N-acyl-L-homoserine lactone synthetase
MDKEQATMRFIRLNEKLYIRKEDVIAYMLEIASTEETDVRLRIEQACANIQKLGDKKDRE